jgi:hypothetical protein
VALFSSACDGGFESPSRVDSLRVFAVATKTRASEADDWSQTASGSPGALVRLELIAGDGSANGALSSVPRPLQIAWFGGCDNPPTRQFFACYPLLSALSGLLESKVVDTPADRLPGFLFRASTRGAPPDLAQPDTRTATAFEFTLPTDILTRAPRVSTDPVHFGVSYEFFALCAGELRARPDLHDRVPLDCVDPTSGKSLDQRDFVTGFTSLYTYEGESNANPRLDAVEFAGGVVGSPCVSDADCESPVVPGLTRVCSDSQQCTLRLQRCSSVSCPKFLISPSVAAPSLETLADGTHEVTWANYFATAGAFDPATELVNDRSLGLIADHGSYYRPPQAPDVTRVRFWITIDDQRGGTAYSTFDADVGD